MRSMSPADRVILRYAIPRTRPDWALSEEPVPESQPHDQTLDLLKAILLAWIARAGRSAHVARNLAIRWEASQPNIGTDPDLCVLDPKPSDADHLESLCTWRPGHKAPKLAIEVVSSKAKKDYTTAPEKCAAAGIEELWVFDPHLLGPRMGGGPHRLQLWRREDDAFIRVFAGEGPVFSPTVGGFLFAVHEGQRLRIAEDREGTRWWPTPEENERAEKERERAEKERERAEKERERAEKEAALVRIAELEARLAKG